MTATPVDPLLERAVAAAQHVAASPASGREEAEAILVRAKLERNDEALSVAARAAAWAARELYDHPAADELIAEAVRAARRGGFDDRLSEALVTRSAIRLEEGRTGAARNDLVLARTHASHGAVPDVAFAEALLEERTGNLGAASAAYAEVIELSAERIDVRAKAYNNWAQVRRMLGDFAAAQRLLELAAADAATFSPALAAIVAHNMAGVVAEAGRPAEALRRYDEAAEMLEAAGLPLHEHYLDKTQTFAALRLLPEARDAIDRAVRALDVPGGSLMLADALITQARIATLQREPDEASAAAHRAVGLLTRQRRWGWRAAAALVGVEAEIAAGQATADVLRRLRRVEQSLRDHGDVFGMVSASLLAGRVAGDLGRSRSARRSFLAAADVAQTGPLLLRVQGRVAAALAAELDGATSDAARICRRGLDELERYRASLSSSELRARAALHGAELSEIGLRTALRGGRPLAVWSWLERTRAVALARAGASPQPAEVGALMAELRAVSVELAAPLEDHEVRRDLLRRAARLEARIRQVSWRTTGEQRGGIANAPSQRELAGLRTALGDRTLIEFGAIDGRFVAVATSIDRLELHELGGVADVAEARDNLGFALSRLSRPRSAASVQAARASAVDSLASLSRHLMAPLASSIGPHREVVVVPPSGLIGVPWGALPHLADRVVCVAPSAATWRSTSSSVPVSERVAIAAGPRLGAAKPEAERIARIYSEPSLLVADAATSSNVLAAAEGAATVHLACHGRLRSDSPSFSGFSLADGPLTVHDLEQLDTPAHRWVLAACDLGRAGALSGPDLEGVLAALLGGGAAAVVAAVTPIPDDTATELMIPLHQALAAGASTPEALAQARESIDDRDPLGFVTKVAFACYGAG